MTLRYQLATMRRQMLEEDAARADYREDVADEIASDRKYQRLTERNTDESLDRVDNSRLRTETRKVWL